MLINKELYNTISSILKKAQPRDELNFILIDKDNIVCTDTKRLLSIRHDLAVRAKSIVDLMMVKAPTKDGYTLDSDLTLSNRKASVKLNSVALNYPDYTRVILNKQGSKSFECSKHDIIKTLYKLEFTFNEGFIKDVLTILEDTVVLYYNSPTLPFMIGDSNINYVVMPIL